MKTDIQNKEDLLEIMELFYEKLLSDKSMAFFFTEVAPVNLQTHLPDLALFWEQILFFPNGYNKNIMQMHLDINQKHPLKNEHFQCWISHLYDAIDQKFEGEKCEEMKSRAKNIADVMKFKSKWG